MTPYWYDGKTLHDRWTRSRIAKSISGFRAAIFLWEKMNVDDADEDRVITFFPRKIRRNTEMVSLWMKLA